MEQLGYLQTDTLSIGESANHHTLWTRIPDYQTAYLEELAEERKVFEYWFHAASYLPMKDFRFILPQMLDVKQSETHYYNADTKIMKYVLDTVRTEGPQKKAGDFRNETKKAGSWWSWKPTKVALERLLCKEIGWFGAETECKKHMILVKRFYQNQLTLQYQLNLNLPNI